LRGCCTEKIFVQGAATKAPQPIDLSNEPELQELTSAVDMDELLAEYPRDTPIHRS
jgi:hypothetical protein